LIDSEIEAIEMMCANFRDPESIDDAIRERQQRVRRAGEPGESLRPVLDLLAL
jgi:hypothetical protein